MVGCSLTLDGVELLGMRGGMKNYLAAAKTFGIPLLAPWGNRLGSDIYRAAGVDATVTAVAGVHRDGNGLAIHGLMAGTRTWDVVTSADDDEAVLRATLHFDNTLDCYDAFPFPHDLTVTAVLREAVLTIGTSVTPTTSQAVPIAFGWHPYFVVPGLPREQWELALPFTDRLVLDAKNLPTGEVQQWSWEDGELGDRVVDDLFVSVAPGTVASVGGNGLRIVLEYTDGYPVAVAYAPASDDLVAIEPMTAPTDPFSGTFPLAEARPGETYEAVFRIRIEQE